MVEREGNLAWRCRAPLRSLAHSMPLRLGLQAAVEPYLKQQGEVWLVARASGATDEPGQHINGASGQASRTIAYSSSQISVVLKIRRWQLLRLSTRIS